jgi:hypothetical protein
MWRPSVEAMRFTMDIDLAALTGDTEAELGRILRYWGGNLKYYDLTQPVPPVECSDSAYAVVGSWRVG